MQSTLRTRPAPREIQTENLSVLRPANRGSTACFHLESVLVTAGEMRVNGFSLPAIGEEAPVKCPEEEVKEQLGGSKLLLEELKVACWCAHDCGL